MSKHTGPWIDEATFHADVEYIESLWQRRPVGSVDMPIIDIGQGTPLLFVPILEHLEFVYARQIPALSATRRVLLYRRQETRSRKHPMGLPERAEELRQVLDSLGLESVDLVGHGDAAMVLFEFATRYPERCRSLIIIAQGADYQIAPHPFIWLLHELFVRLPVEYFLPAWYLRGTVVNYIVASRPASKSLAHPDLTPRHPVPTRAEVSSRDRVATTSQAVEASGNVAKLPRHLIDEQFRRRNGLKQIPNRAALGGRSWLLAMTEQSETQGEALGKLK